MKFKIIDGYVYGTAVALSMFNFHMPEFVIVGAIKQIGPDLWKAKIKKTK